MKMYNFKETYYKNGLFVSISVGDRYMQVTIDTCDGKILHVFHDNGICKNLYFIKDGKKWKGLDAVEKFLENPKEYELLNRLCEGGRNIQMFPVYREE